MYNEKIGARKTSIVATDLFSYAVLSVCQDLGLFHYQDYLVLTREKQPSLFARKQILEALKGKIGYTNEQVQAMTKGKVNECWGDDMFL